MTEETSRTGGLPATTSGSAPGRRFGDEEIRRILQSAAELQERSDAVPHEPGRGLSLEELRQVAAEVGIDPRFVDLAASHVDAPVERTGNVAAGAPTRWHLRSSVPGEIAKGDLDRILQVIRTTLHEKGEVSEVWGRIEWSHDEVGTTIVGISTRDGSTEFDVSSVKSDEATLIHLLGVPFGGFFGAAVLKGVLGISGAGILPWIGLMGLLSYGGTRIAWKARSAWWERRLQRLIDRLSGVAREVARLPAPGGGESTDGDPAADASSEARFGDGGTPGVADGG